MAGDGENKDNKKEENHQEDNDKHDNTDAEIWQKIGEFTLTKKDKAIIKGELESGWLTDTIINAGQQLLRQQFPQIKGLQNVLLNEIQELEPVESGERFVQILHEEKNHWIVISNVHVSDPDKAVKIYDSQSMQSINYSEDIAKAILKIMAKSDAIDVDIELVSQQQDLNQCGLYSLAFARALCEREDPSLILFTNCPQLLRDHLINSFKSGVLAKFPTGRDTHLAHYDLTR